MRKSARTWLLVAVALGSVASKISKLPDADRAAFSALSAWMTDDEEKAYLKFKTPEERAQYLKDRGYYDRWYNLDAGTQDQISAGTVLVGWHQENVFMAWGEPYDRKRLTGRPASRSELFIYRFEVADDGSVMVWAPKSKATYKAVDKYQMDVYSDDGIITSLVRKEDWE